MSLFNGLARVTFLSKYGNGQAISNTFHIFNATAGAPPDLAELTQLGTDLHTYFATAYEAVLTADDTFVQITVGQVTDPTSPVVELEAVNTVNHVGSLSSGRTTPRSAAVLFSLRSPVASRRSRGHLFLPGIPSSSSLNGDNWSSSLLTNWNSLQALFNNGVAPTPTWTGAALADYYLAIYSKTGALLGEPSVNGVSAVVVSPVVRWLRSRERGAS